MPKEKKQLEATRRKLAELLSRIRKEAGPGAERALTRRTVFRDLDPGHIDELAKVLGDRRANRLITSLRDMSKDVPLGGWENYWPDFYKAASDTAKSGVASGGRNIISRGHYGIPSLTFSQAQMTSGMGDKPPFKVPRPLVADLERRRQAALHLLNPKDISDLSKPSYARLESMSNERLERRLRSYVLEGSMTPAEAKYWYRKKAKHLGPAYEKTLQTPPPLKRHAKSLSSLSGRSLPMLLLMGLSVLSKATAPKLNA